MAHSALMQYMKYVKGFFPEDFRSRRVLEIGSLDINGSVRPLFADCDYIGLDVAAGPGVDVVCQGQDYADPDGTFDVVVSVEAMEHNPFWKETFRNMARLTRPGGLVMMTCATLGRPEHGTDRSTPRDSPLTLAIGWNYYRNLVARDFEGELPLSDWFQEYGFFTHHYCNDLYFLGLRSGPRDRRWRARKAISSLRLRYLIRNLRQWRSLRTMALTRLLGDERYRAPL